MDLKSGGVIVKGKMFAKRFGDPTSSDRRVESPFGFRKQ